jgi:hypothetical protein
MTLATPYNDDDLATLQAAFDAAYRAYGDADAHYRNEFFRRMEEQREFIRVELAEEATARDAAERALAVARYALRAARNGENR